MLTCMSIRTIALDATVYERLAARKRSGESFSKAIDRLLAEVGGASTGAEILRRIKAFPALPEADAATFVRVIDEGREPEVWETP